MMQMIGLLLVVRPHSVSCVRKHIDSLLHILCNKRMLLHRGICLGCYLNVSTSLHRTSEWESIIIILLSKLLWFGLLLLLWSLLGFWLGGGLFCLLYLPVDEVYLCVVLTLPFP